MPYKRKSATAKKHMKRHSAKKHMRPHSAKKHMKRHSAKKHMNQQKGGKLNEFFKLMLNAKKQDLKSFKYKDNTYNQFTTKTGLKTYKKA
jgi:hypothetical protein